MLAGGGSTSRVGGELAAEASARSADEGGHENRSRAARARGIRLHEQTAASTAPALAGWYDDLRVGSPLRFQSHADSTRVAVERRAGRRLNTPSMRFTSREPRGHGRQQRAGRDHRVECEREAAEHRGEGERGGRTGDRDRRSSSHDVRLANRASTRRRAATGVMPSTTSGPGRDPTTECASSWARIETKNSATARTAAATVGAVRVRRERRELAAGERDRRGATPMTSRLQWTLVHTLDAGDPAEPETGRMESCGPAPDALRSQHRAGPQASPPA